MMAFIRIGFALAFAVATTTAMAQASKCQKGCVNSATTTCACQ
jgi:hypothetical protein